MIDSFIGIIKNMPKSGELFETKQEQFFETYYELIGTNRKIIAMNINHDNKTIELVVIPK